VPDYTGVNMERQDILTILRMRRGVGCNDSSEDIKIQQMSPDEILKEVIAHRPGDKVWERGVLLYLGWTKEETDTQVEEIKAWKTSDGEIFEDLECAKEHEEWICQIDKPGRDDAIIFAENKEIEELRKIPPCLHFRKFLREDVQYLRGSGKRITYFYCRVCDQEWTETHTFRGEWEDRDGDYDLGA